MKKLVLLLILLCGSIAVGEDDYLSLWLSGNNLAYQNTNIKAMLGYRWSLDENFDLELGPALSWRTWTEQDNTDDTQSQLGIGAFAAVHAVDLVTIPNPLYSEDLSWMPKELASEPYFMLSYVIDTDGKGAVLSPGIGTRVFDLFSLQTDYVMTQGEAVSDEWRVGISAKFKL